MLKFACNTIQYGNCNVRPLTCRLAHGVPNGDAWNTLKQTTNSPDHYSPTLHNPHPATLRFGCHMPAVTNYCTTAP